MGSHQGVVQIIGDSYMKVLKLALCAVAASAAMGSAAMAQEATVAYNIGVVSDYVFRGYTQTMEDPAIQGGVDISAGKGYAGIWASNVDFGDSTQMEVDLYGGYKPTVGPVNLDLGLIYYGYVDAPSGADYGNFEFKAAASTAVGPATVGAAVYASPDTFGSLKEATYYEINGAIPAGPISISGAYGSQTYKDADSYALWNVGASYTFADHYTVDLRYYGTDVDNLDSYTTIGIKAAF